RLMEIAKSIGSDVPFFLDGPSAIVRGRGEEVEKIEQSGERPGSKWVPIIPSRPMPTPAVYGWFDKLQLGKESNLAPEPPWSQWVNLASKDLLPLLVND